MEVWTVYTLVESFSCPQSHLTKETNDLEYSGGGCNGGNRLVGGNDGVSGIGQVMEGRNKGGIDERVICDSGEMERGQW